MGGVESLVCFVIHNSCGLFFIEKLKALKYKPSVLYACEKYIHAPFLAYAPDIAHTHVLIKVYARV